MWVYKGVEVESNNMYQYLYITHMDWDNLVAIEDYTNIYLSKQDIEMQDITSITPIPNPPKLLPVGTKVRVFEEYLDDCIDLDNQIVEIEDMHKRTFCYSLDCGSFSLTVPARAVYPVLD